MRRSAGPSPRQITPRRSRERAVQSGAVKAARVPSEHGWTLLSCGCGSDVTTGSQARYRSGASVLPPCAWRVPIARRLAPP